MNCHASIIKIKDLTPSDKINMLQLHLRYYDNVFEAHFFTDLMEKDWVILLRDDAGLIQGFSTIQLIWLEIEGVEHLFLFSGDTVVSESIRNAPALTGAFIHFMYALIGSYPETPRFWFLITKGYRTYRFLPLYFNEYYPIHNKNVPGYFQKVLDTVAFHKFGDAYIPEAHLLRFKTDRDYLKPEHAAIAKGRLNKPDVKFFLEKNPNYHQGEELTCITAISTQNFNSLVERVRQSTIVKFEWEE